jgi:hypothetical protein
MKKVIRLNEKDIEKLVNKIIKEDEEKPGLWANIRAKRERGEAPARKGSEAYKKAVKAGKKINAETDNMEGEEGSRYMFFSNLQQMKRQCEYLLDFDENQIEEILENGHDWAQDHIAEAKNNLDQVFDFLMNEIKGEDTKEPQMEDYLPNLRGKKIYEDQYGSVELLPIQEAEYKGRKVTLNKPFYTPDGPKKSSVYVKNAKGNVVKVNFGDPNMKIKKSIPSHRKSFRARHKCSEKTDRTTPGYWSCKAW